MNTFDSMDTAELVEIYKEDPMSRDAAKAMEAIIKNNDNLVLHIINRYFSSYRHNYMEDMRQEGRMAMYQYAAKYDSAKGRFSTFITPYIIDAIKTYICEVHGISTHYSGQIKKYNRAVESLKQAGLDDPTFGDIAEEMGVGIDAVQRVHEMAGAMNHASIEGDGKDRELCSPFNASPEALLEKQCVVESVGRAVAQLPDNERAVIMEAFFSDSGNKEVPLTEVAARLGMDVSTVRRLKNKALRRMESSTFLRDFNVTRKRRELEDYADTLGVTFALSGETVSANVEIALNLAESSDITL